MINVRTGDSLKGSARVLRNVQLHTHHINLVLVIRINPDLTKDPSIRPTDTLHISIILTSAIPAFTAIVRAEHSSTAYDAPSRPTVRVSRSLLSVPRNLIVVYECVAVSYTQLTLPPLLLV